MIKLKDLLFERDENDTKDSGGILYYYGDKVLLCLSSGSGKWNVPKGHIMKGEDPLDGAIREFKEETGINVSSEIKYLNSFPMENEGTFYAYFTNIKSLIFPSNEAIDSIEHEEWGFFRIQENSLPEPMTTETKETILKLK